MQLHPVQGVFEIVFTRVVLLNLIEREEPSLNVATPPLKRSAALFLLKSKAEARLTQKALQDVINSAGELYEEAIGEVKQEFSCLIVNANIQEETKQMFLRKIDTFEFDIFDGLESEYRQEKYFKENFGYLVGHFHIHVVY